MDMPVMQLRRTPNAILALVSLVFALSRQLFSLLLIPPDLLYCVVNIIAFTKCSTLEKHSIPIYF